MSVRISSAAWQGTAAGIYLTSDDGLLHLLDSEGSSAGPCFDLRRMELKALEQLKIFPRPGKTLELAVVSEERIVYIGETLWDEVELAFARDGRNLYVYLPAEGNRELARLSGGSWRCRDERGQQVAGELILGTRELLEGVWRGEPLPELVRPGRRSRRSALAK